LGGTAKFFVPWDGGLFLWIRILLLRSDGYVGHEIYS
jgi:hypothetical protein